MEGKEKEEILTAIARLEVKNEHLERYIYKELKPHIQNLCDKIEDCVEKSEECYHKNLRWMIATLLTSVTAILGWACVIVKVMV